jgi:predicted ArsR family transcriptional regulator
VASQPAQEDTWSALAVPARRRLLELLREEGPLPTQQLADRTGLHLTTVRFHLDVLLSAGLVEAAISPTGGPGRPRQIFTAVPDQPAEDDAHRSLVGLLAAEFATDPADTQARAERAGHRWAETFAPDPRSGARRASTDQAALHVRDTFDRLGFAPRLISEGRAQRIELHACPFREAARTHPDVICAAHRGLLRGMLARLGAPGPEPAVLQPFVTPDLCIAEFSSAPRGPARRRSEERG